MYGKRSVHQAFGNGGNLGAKKQRKTKILPPGVVLKPTFRGERPSQIHSRGARPTAIPSRGSSYAQPSRGGLARPSRPPSARKSVKSRQPVMKPTSTGVKFSGGYGSPYPQGGYGPQPSNKGSLSGGYGSTPPSGNFARPSSLEKPVVPQFSDNPSIPQLSMHRPDFSGPTTLQAPQVNRKFPDWVYDEKFGVLKFDENIMVYHIKGYPMCPWQDLVREGPLDPKWQEKKAEAKRQAEEEKEGSEADTEADEAYVPPGSSGSSKKYSRRDNRSTRKVSNNSSYYDTKNQRQRLPEPKKRTLPKSISIPRKNPARKPQPVPKRFKWIQCIQCSKWRKIPHEIPNDTLGDRWSCRDNRWDNYHNRCTDVQEMEEETRPQPSRNVTPATQYGYRPPTTPLYHDPPEPVHSVSARAPTTKKKRSGGGRRSGSMSVSEALNKMKSRNPDHEKERRDLYKTLEKFLGKPPAITTLCSMPIDLYHLYTQVCNRGGFDEVTANKQWRQIFRTMENYKESHTSASYALKKCYTNNLLEYEKAHFRHY